MFYLLIGFTLLLLFVLTLAWLGSNYLIARRKPDPATSPADYGLAFEEVAFQSGDAITLRGWYIPAANSTRTVIFCSGANGSMDPDVAAAPWFHTSGLNVLIFDWRGHGRSDGRVVSLGYNERYDLIAAVEYARSRGARRIGVLGFSMGGSVALSTTAVCLDIDAVAADGAFVHLVTAVAGGLRERGLWDGASFLLTRLLLVTASLRLGINLFSADPIRWVDRIAPRPVLLIYGGRDPYVPDADITLLFHLAKDPKVLWRVPEAAHRDVHIHRPEEYRQKIVSFFEQSL